MAALIGLAVADNLATGGSTKTLLRLEAPTNQRVRILEVGVSCQGVSTTAEPIEFQVYRCSADGTGSSLTPVQADDSIADTIQTTATENFSAEPLTPGDVLKSFMIHPQTGVVYPVPGRDEMIMGAGDDIAIRAVAPGATVDCSVYFKFEE